MISSRLISTVKSHLETAFTTGVFSRGTERANHAFSGKKLYKDATMFRGDSIIWFSDNGVGELPNTYGDWKKIASV